MPTFLDIYPHFLERMSTRDGNLDKKWSKQQLAGSGSKDEESSRSNLVQYNPSKSARTTY